MSDKDAVVMPPSRPAQAFTFKAEVTTNEICDAHVAEARKKANLRIRQVKNLIRTSGEELQEMIKSLTEACKTKAEGFMDAELRSACASLEHVFGVPAKSTITPLGDTFNKEDRTFKVKVSIGFEDRTPGIISIHNSSAGYAQDLHMTSEIENGDEVTRIFDEIEALRKTREGYTKEINELEEFLDSGIQVLEDEFKSRVVRAKIGACEDGDQILESMRAAMADGDVQELIPASLLSMGLGNQAAALPAPAADTEG